MAYTTLPTLYAGMVLTGDDITSIETTISELRPVSARKTGTSTVNNSTTLVDVSEMSVAVEANVIYEFMLDLWYSTNTTADCKIGWTFPSGLTMLYSAVAHYTTAEAVIPFSSFIQTSTPTFGGTGNFVLFRGFVTVSSTAGTLQLQHAQSTANVSNTNIVAGSQIVLRRLT